MKVLKPYVLRLTACVLGRWLRSKGRAMAGRFTLLGGEKCGTKRFLDPDTSNMK